MGFFDKIKKLLIEEVPEAQAAQDETAPADIAPTAPVPMTTAQRLQALAVGESEPDPSYAVQLMEQLREDGRAARAIALARRLLDSFPNGIVRLRLAEFLSERGQDDEAAQELQEILATDDAPLAAVMLAAEIAERAGKRTKARSLYQRVLATDLDFPRARERALRLAGDASPGADLAGATIATEGALAKGRFRIERELGRGGAGTVFVATDLRTERRIALKVYHRRGPVERQRLRVEVRVPAKIEHPGVVRIFDLDEALGAIAMEWVGGGSVRAALAHPMTVERAKRMMRTAVEAVSFVHQAGYVHRDLKPSNFLLRPDDRVVLTDFGLALPVGAAPVARAGGEGTLQYMAPEQRRNGAAEPSSDVYALGVCIRDVLVATADAPPEWAEIGAACMRSEPAQRPSVDVLGQVFAPSEGGARVAQTPASN